MTKVLVYIMDKIVWMLLITALTIQALQTAGIVDSPKGFQEISYAQGNEYNYQLSIGTTEPRGKRQTQERSQLLDNIFNRQFGQGDYFFRLDRTKVITAKM